MHGESWLHSRSLIYGVYHWANFKHVCGERNGRFNYACIRRYSNRLLCVFSLCAYYEERYVFPFYRNFLIIYRVIVRDCGKLLLPNSALAVGISALFVVFSTMTILYETSNIIHGGETNYIRATVNIYVSIYNLFISLLRLLSIFSSDD